MDHHGRFGRSERSEVEKSEKKAYYGGRVETFRHVSSRRVVMACGLVALAATGFGITMWVGLFPLASIFNKQKREEKPYEP
jgi:hypothetical protein